MDPRPPKDLSLQELIAEKSDLQDAQRQLLRGTDDDSKLVAARKGLLEELSPKLEACDRVADSIKASRSSCQKNPAPSIQALTFAPSNDAFACSEALGRAGVAVPSAVYVTRRFFQNGSEFCAAVQGTDDSAMADMHNKALASLTNSVTQAQKALDDTTKNQQIVTKRMQLVNDELDQREETAKTVSSRLPAIIVVLGIFSIAIMVMVRRFKESIQLQWVESGQVTQFMTVMVLVIVILALGLTQTIKSETLGTLLAGISGYMLSQGIARQARKQGETGAMAQTANGDDKKPPPATPGGPAPENVPPLPANVPAVPAPDALAGKP